eukprot:scaffold4483_cov16-Tisochrysis_lutea.AAC.2
MEKGWEQVVLGCGAAACVSLSLRPWAAAAACKAISEGVSWSTLRGMLLFMLSFFQLTMPTSTLLHMNLTVAKSTEFKGPQIAIKGPTALPWLQSAFLAHLMLGL